MQISASSLLISTYNWPEALGLCLRSVARQELLPGEVIIADDGSGPETLNLIEGFRLNFPVPIKHVWHEDRGFRKSQVLNKAVQQCSTDYIIQIDGDVILHRSFVRDHMDVAEKGVFIRGTRAHLNPQKTEEMLNSGEIELHPLFSKGVEHRLNALRIPLLKSFGIRKEMKSRSVRGCNLAFWKSDFVLVNGYDNELQGWGHEDEELAARFINNRIMKKIVKLCAIQYHLHHPESPRDHEPVHSRAIEHTVKNKIKSCANGYSCN